MVVSFTFFLMHLIPGDPFIGEQNIPKELYESLKNSYGLNKPLYIQYGIFLKKLCLADLGESIVYPGRKVTSFIQNGFWISFHLGLQALFLSTFLGITFGSIASLYKENWQDKMIMILSTLLISTPTFVLASLLQLTFSMKLRLFPVALWDSFSHTILPTIALASVPTAFITKLVKEALSDVLKQDYILLAKAKGLSTFHIMTKHALRNAILPVVAYLGPLSAQILTGTLMVERIFAIPGLGAWLISSIGSRDYPMIVGLTLFFSIFLLISNILVDLLYRRIDPRISREGPIEA